MCAKHLKKWFRPFAWGSSLFGFGIIELANRFSRSQVSAGLFLEAPLEGPGAQRGAQQFSGLWGGRDQPLGPHGKLGDGGGAQGFGFLWVSLAHSPSQLSMCTCMYMYVQMHTYIHMCKW